MSDIKVRVGQQNSIKVISSLAGGAAFAQDSLNSTNVIGGIASVTQLNVSGISTFVGVATFVGDVYIGGDLYIRDDLVFDEFTARNINVTGVGTIATLNSTTGNLTFISGTNLNYTGVGTIATLNSTTSNIATANIVTGIITNISGRNLNYTGVGTIATLNSTNANLTTANIVTGIITTISGTNLNYTGVGTIATINSTNISNIGFLTSTNAYVSNALYYGQYNTGGVAYFNSNGLMVSTGSTSNAINYTNYILTTDNVGITTWSSTIDGGEY